MSSIPELSAFEFERYSRQMRLPGFGLKAQQQLKAATVLISRVGGVGGTVAMRLAHAGVGHLILAHGGQVRPEYLNRWPLVRATDIGRPCIDAVLETLTAMNASVKLTGECTNVTEENVSRLVEQADLIVDAAPLFEERYLLNQQAVRQKKPLVMGAMYGTEAYISTYIPGETPCLACMYPSKPPYWNSIEAFPVIGPCSDMAGAVAAMEAIKVLTGFGMPLKGRLWFFDLQSNCMSHLHVHRRLDCPVCGEGT
ncbi:adenylyltransferase [Reticulibacter mediterranei]|uniref:Adenylyltransferase n=1 Tax=Reticulibacter mediterranei TaxID=2778369 RepID=A0A8J3ILI6_9CHLR|nr:HesA/MoeB/ThiF family protein [Reticulibacter mediterranei]GHO94655.1 adenylyltransferase [Reticulibacter mediterranei]